MHRLIQIIGPPECGKTWLRRYIAPNAVDIGGCLPSAFNASMEDYQHGYYFEDIAPRHYEKLTKWLACKQICIDRMGSVPTHRPNVGPWIFLGLEPIEIEGSLIWDVKKRGS